MQRLSDDEDAEEIFGESPFKEFLLLSHCKNDARPQAYIYQHGSGLDWNSPIIAKNQTLFDSLVVCDATIELSTAVLDLTKKDFTAYARWFSELVTDVAVQLKGKMRSSVLQLDDCKELLTKAKQK